MQYKERILEMSTSERVRACKAVIRLEAFIASHDYSGYDRPSSQSNGSEKVYQSDLAYLKKLKRIAGMI
jgi:hypothetical protein